MGTQACPPAPATVTGTIEPDDVIGPTDQGIDAGEFDELVSAIRAGPTYANVHSSKYPAARSGPSWTAGATGTAEGASG